MRVGIDALALAVPPLALELRTLAEARGVPPAKFVDGIGVERMAIAPLDEDTVTLAARAGAAALAQAGISASEIGYLVVGTETAVDHSKPVASYVQGLLGIGAACRVYETKHACFGATAGVLGALEWIRAGGGKRPRIALVIAADIARYGLQTPGEPTQGGAGVALILREDPRLVEIDATIGHYASDVHDFWRPLPSKDALVDGAFSVQCYLNAVTGAYRNFQEEREETERFSALALDRLVYHVPYGKMAIKAHRQLLAEEGLDAAAADATFAEKVGPSLTLPRRIGNSYTGSLYAALGSLLATDPAPLDGARLGLFSYGSGSAAAFFTGTVVAGAQKRVAGLGDALERQRILAIDEYEALFHARNDLDTRPYAAPEGPATSPRYLGVDGGKRRYG
jgi:hydroxymethylglutaryl-CoA synthase